MEMSTDIQTRSIHYLADFAADGAIVVLEESPADANTIAAQ